MADEMKTKLAQQVYQTLCEAIDNRNWRYGKEEDKLLVHFGVNGDDIPMQFIIFVDEDRQLIRLMSPLPFKMSEAKLMEGAIATCVASYRIADGSFDYDLTDGRIVFRMTASFRGSVIGEGLIQYLISCACAVVDNYNEKFLAIDKDLMSISDFIDNETK